MLVLGECRRRQGFLWISLPVMIFSTILKLWGYFHSFYLSHLNGEGTYQGQILLSIFYKLKELYDILKSPWEATPSQQILSAKNFGPDFQRNNFPGLLEQAGLWFRHALSGSSSSLWKRVHTLQLAAPVPPVPDFPIQASCRSHPRKCKDAKAPITPRPVKSDKFLGGAKIWFIMLSTQVMMV